MQSWISDELSKYYTIAQIDGKLLAIQNSIAENNEDMLAETVALRKAIADTKAEITAAYTNIIEDAINTNNGIVDGKIATEVENVNTRIDNEVSELNTKITSIENILNKIEQDIATINEQISNINISIEALLETDNNLKSYINSLQGTATILQESINATNEQIEDVKTLLQGETATAKAEVLAELATLKNEMESELAQITAAITTLQAKDVELEQKITTLHAFVQNELNETKDWTEATFATLTQYNSLADEVATVKTQIQAINSSITALEERINNKISTDITAATTILNANIQQKVTEITDSYSSAINTAKEGLTAAYTIAISTSITVLETSMQSWVSDKLNGYYSISEIDGLVATMTDEFNSKLEAQKAYLVSLINSLSTDLNNQIANNSNLIEALRNDVNSLSEQQAQLAEQIANNATAISKNVTDINANALAIANSCNGISENSTRIAENNRLIEVNSNLIQENQEAIATLSQINNGSVLDLLTNINKNAEDITANATLIAKNATAINNNAEGIAQNVADIQQLRQDLATAKEEFTDAYKVAINTAITTLGGTLRNEISTQIEELNTRINNEITTVNTTIGTLTSRVETLEDEVEEIHQEITGILLDIANLQQQIANLLKRIQDITYIPKYSDGKACVENEIVELNFLISPKDAVKDIADNWQSILSMKAVYTQTRAVSFIELPILTCEADEVNGIISISASGENLSEEFYNGTQTASVVLSISDGNSNLTSNFISFAPFHPYNEIWYTSIDGEIITPNATNVFGANIISNNVIDGKGRIKFDNAVTSIGNKAFFDNEKLTSITIPETVIIIGDSAFYACTNITIIVFRSPKQPKTTRNNQT